jgi:hypothetical protein
MAPHTKRPADAPPAHRAGPRRLIAGLRITPQDAALLNVVRPLLPEADSERELAYWLWRRGLELTLAEVVGLGAALPPGTTDEVIAALAAQRLLLCVPLLRRTEKLALLGIEVTPHATCASPSYTAPAASTAAEAIDATASDAIVGLGGSDFL